MYRAIPGMGNKFLTKKWEEEKSSKNRKKLKNVKSQIDLSSPDTYDLTKKNTKRDNNGEGKNIISNSCL
jgi:hypothetical protein